MSTEVPEVAVSPTRKMFLSGASVVWLIPLFALVAALGVAWQNYQDRGPLIVVEFEAGAGITARETELRYRDVTVGVVETVGFTPGLERVTATIRVDQDVAPFIDQGSLFWIVQPEVTAQGITGLSTVLSGVYIEGSWDEQIGLAATRFSGSSVEPLIRPGQGGLEIAFRTGANSQLTDNAPILYKGIEVGRVGRAKIAPRGNFAIVEALIFDEHRSLVNENTRFWDASGFTVTIGPAGAEIDFSSLATLVGGGITFDTFVSGGGRVSDGTVFEIFPDEESARNSLFNASEVEPLKVAAVFDENISGLVVGAPVELSGFRVGEVEALSGIVDYDQFGDSRVRLNVILSIQPSRLGLPGAVTASNALGFVRERVANGLRARLASASLLTGGLKVELVMVDDAAPAALIETENQPPVMPVTDSEVSDAAATVEGVFTRINNLPIEELLESAIGFLNAAEALVSSEDVRETPQDLRLLLAELQGLVSSNDVQNIPVALNATLQRVEGLVERLEQAQLVDRLTAALDGAAEAAQAVETSITGVPDLIDQIGRVAANAEALDLETLVSELTTLTRNADALITSEDVNAVPAALRQALEEINSALQDLRSGGAIANVNETFAATRRAANQIAGSAERLPEIIERLTETLDAAAAAAEAVEVSVAGVPDLVEDMRRVAATAAELELDELVAELTALTRAAEALINSDDARALPQSLKQALDELNATLKELREGGAVENVNQTLASARNAADTIAVSAEDLPQIIERLNGLFDQASQTIAGYNQGDQMGRAVQATLRDIQKAADALASLARTIERNPNALLLGR